MRAVTYRKADPTDVPALARLRLDDEPGGASEDRMLRYVMGQHDPRHALAPRGLWMAASSGSPIGYVAGHLTTRLGCAGELQWIYVASAHRDGRVADELLRLIAAWFVERDARRVCVDAGADRARRFYERHGARPASGPWMVWEDIGGVLLAKPKSRDTE
jgi:ribosomal protein S18 acetylase RimI-like enzyme